MKKLQKVILEGVIEGELNYPSIQATKEFNREFICGVNWMGLENALRSIAWDWHFRFSKIVDISGVAIFKEGNHSVIIPLKINTRAKAFVNIFQLDPNWEMTVAI